MGAKKIRFITREAFARYGTVIELKPQSQDGWEVVVKVENSGWRIAVLEFSRHTASMLENHPQSKESFEPLYGTALLIVAENNAPDSFEVFLLDKPVCLFEGIWHQVISLSQVSCVKITENLEVACVFHDLRDEVTAYVSTVLH